MKKTKIITYAALFIALSLILKTFLTFFLFGSTKFGFSFIPEVIGSAAFGPGVGGVIGGLADILGLLIKQDGAYFPGFTISAILKCVIYALFLYKKPKSLINITYAILSVMVFIDLGINTVWINMVYGTKVSAILLSKILSLPLYGAAQITLLYVLFKYLGKEIAKISE